MLHPLRVTRDGQDAYGRRIAGEWTVSEGVHLREYLEGGHSISAAAGGMPVE
jgi:hypothetical protein